MIAGKPALNQTLCDCKIIGTASAKLLRVKGS